MLTFFRRVANSKIGTWVVAGIGVAILGGFALADLSNFGTGNVGLGFGMGSTTLAKVGGEGVDERDLADLLQRRLQQVRQQHPDATYASVMDQFNPTLEDLIDERALIAFADKYGFPLSKRLLDAEIATLPAAKGLNGQFSEQAYQAFLRQNRFTDEKLRELIAASKLQQLLLTPVATNARIPVGIATPYANLLLEQRDGEGAIVPIEPFKAGLKPTDAQLQQYYSANSKTRYMIPEQRVLRIARIGPEQVAGVTASDQEIAAYYNQHKESYAPSDTRSLSQVVVQDQATANGIALRAKAGGNLAAAAAPAGANAAVSTLKDQTSAAYAGVAGQQAAAAVFAAPAGSVVGPVKTDFGWAVVKIESASKVPGKTLEQARADIGGKLNADKRKGAIEDLVDQVQNALDHGSNFDEAVRAAKLQVTPTPPIGATGASRTDASFKLPPELAPVVKAGFDLAPSDPPELVTLGGNAGYAVVAPGQVTPAAPAPLDSIREQVTNDWINDQAMQRARAAATQIATRATGNVSLADAIRAVGGAIPPPRPLTARRIQLSQQEQQGNVSPALKLLFETAPGKARMAANPQGGGFFVIKVSKITPGNAMVAPGIIGQVTASLGRSVQQEYAQEFLADIKRTLKVKRNESAIQALRARLLSNGS
jgi:peptidyl-prolyl cis-trans isomerase D